MKIPNKSTIAPKSFIFGLSVNNSLHTAHRRIFSRLENNPILISLLHVGQGLLNKFSFIVKKQLNYFNRLGFVIVKQ
jgi:hypothetical protein